LRPNVGMADERNVTFVLDSHDPEKLPMVLQTPENNTIFDFVPKFFNGHVWLMPAIIGYDSFISLSSVIDDPEYRIEIGICTLSYHIYLLE
jgi:hypothetical protein